MLEQVVVVMNKMKQISLFLVAFLITACDNPNKQVVHNNVITLLTDSISVPTYEIIGDTLPLDALWPTDIAIVDSFLLIGQHKDDKLIHIYSKNSLLKLGSFIEKGGGPYDVNLWNGFNQYWVENNEAKLLIQSYPQYVATLNLNKTLNQQEVVFDEKFNFSNDSAKAIFLRSNVVYKVKDNFLMSRSTDRIKGTTDYNLSFQWFDYEKDEIKNIVYSTDQAIYPFPFLYAPGGMCYNVNQGKICFAFRYINAFALFDIDKGSSIQLIPNNDITDLKEYVNEQKDAVFFQDVASSNKFVYLATYHGIKQNETEKEGVTIEVYDWNGNHISKIRLKEPIYYIAVDSEDEYLYTVVSDGGIKKYKLPKM